MSTYPRHLLSREPPKAYPGEPEFRLWHFSRDPTLDRFEPHVPATNPDAPPLVWAVDSRHAPLYWFPRDCPRVCIWPVSTTSKPDRAAFFPAGESRVHAIEHRWLERVMRSTLSAYRLPAESFVPSADAGGYWISREPVDASERIEVGDLVARHARAGIKLMTVDELGPFWLSVLASTVEFSGIRLRNSATAAELRPRAPRP